MLRPGPGFGVDINNIASKGDTVMTEHTEVIKAGPLEVSFWVRSTFEVRDERIVLWRDYFDWWNVSRGTLRGLAGIALSGPCKRLPV